MKNQSTANNPPCPWCFNPAAIADSPAPAKKGGAFRRRRTYTCTEDPNHTFYTDEAYAVGSPMLVKKSDGRHMPFEYDRLREGLAGAATPAERASKVEKIARKVATEAEKAAKKEREKEKSRGIISAMPLISTEKLGQLVLDTLKEEEAFGMWIRFALIHKKLGEQKSMKEILKGVQREWEAT